MFAYIYRNKDKSVALLLEPLVKKSFCIQGANCKRIIYCF